MERPILDLTPSVGGTDFVRNDVTAQNFEVRFPSDFTCKDCTLRLLRQADEWSNGYRFWSCADIDIKHRTYISIVVFLYNDSKLINRLINCLFDPSLQRKFVGKEFRETCSGHGKHIASRCKCDKKYYGTRCQFSDECMNDDDCGVQGKCIDIQGSALPRRQCYCNFGWMGPNCAKSK